MEGHRNIRVRHSDLQQRQTPRGNKTAMNANVGLATPPYYINLFTIVK